MAEESRGWDQSKFDEALAEYVKVSSRTLQQIVNTKLYYIGRQAIWNTAKADSYKIKQQLGGIVSVSRLNKAGKTVKRRQLQLVNSTRADVPLAALIIMARLMAKDEPSPFWGRSRAAGISAMNRLVRELLTSRMRSVAFIKSGFVPGVKKLAPLSDKRGEPRTDATAKQIGRAKGDATPAEEGFNPMAQLVNLASARHDHNGALNKFGAAGLQIAFDDETASIWEYVEEKMRPDAEKFNEQQH